MWPGLFEFVDPLEREAIPYALVGSVAASLYGEPRATNDVDLFFREGGGEKHLRDIRAMLGVLGTALDRPWLEQEIARLELTSAWSEVGRAG